MEQRSKDMERRERMDQLIRDEMSQWRWTRAEEKAFRYTVSFYGVEFNPSTNSLCWSRFRILSRLDTKSDDALTDYLKAFMAMCKHQCGLSVGEVELPSRPDIKAEPIDGKRAVAILERIDLLRVLREEVAPHPALDTRLAFCERSPHTPPWWQPARHDKLLVLGVCKHGLGDTYNKLFCDPKMPFADCARKWYANHKSASRSEGQRTSSDEENAAVSEETAGETNMSLKLTSKNCYQTTEDDTGALLELETLPNMGQIEETLSPMLWFSERAIETRLHLIAYVVQDREWSAVTKQDARVAPDALDERKLGPKQHFAIDVETNQAKLHALLAGPQAVHTSGGATMTPGDRSAPPPAYQRAQLSPATSSAPIDLFAPLDRRDMHDFSVAHRTHSLDTVPSSVSSRNLHDDNLSRIMKRQNVPAPENLDELVLGSSAYTYKNPTPSSESRRGRGRGRGRPRRSDVGRGTSVLPDSTNSFSIQNPYAVMMPNVPFPQASFQGFSPFMQQSFEQAKIPIASGVHPMIAYSQAKVNKWLADQASVNSRHRGVAPRLSPEEHVPVVHRETGKRIVGPKAPQLKYIAKWIAENPMYDIDPKWAEGLDEPINLPQDVCSQRHSSMQSSGGMSEHIKGRPPTFDSPSANVMFSNSHLNQSLAGRNPSLPNLSAFDPKPLAATLSNLTGFDSKLLNTFDPKLLSSLGNFDPKNNPLLNSFNSMPNLLGNIAGGNIFANFAGLGLPRFPSLDFNNLPGSNISSESKSKSRKNTDCRNPSSSISTNPQFPFVFPNPNMSYPQLGPSGLNSFGMHSGVSSAYNTLGYMAASSGTSTLQGSSHSASRSTAKSPRSTAPRSSNIVTNSPSSRQQKVPDLQQSTNQFQQIHLPPDPYLLESVSKPSLNYEPIITPETRPRDNDDLETLGTDLSKSDKKELPFDAMRSQVSPEFAAVQEKLLKGDKKDIDVSKKLEQMASGGLSARLVSSAESKKGKDDKDVSEKFIENSSEYISRTFVSEDGISLAHKRTHKEIINEPENFAMSSIKLNPTKKVKDNSTLEKQTSVEKQPDHSTHTGETDLEDLITSSTFN